MSARRNEIMEDGDFTDLQDALVKAWGELDAWREEGAQLRAEARNLRAENDRLRNICSDALESRSCDGTDDGTAEGER